MPPRDIETTKHFDNVKHTVPLEATLGCAGSGWAASCPDMHARGDDASAPHAPGSPAGTISSMSDVPLLSEEDMMGEMGPVSPCTGAVERLMARHGSLAMSC